MGRSVISELDGNSRFGFEHGSLCFAHEAADASTATSTGSAKDRSDIVGN
jgi:hypothetical protein